MRSNNEEYVVEEYLQVEQSTIVSRVRHNYNKLIIKSNTKLSAYPQRLIKYYQEFMIGSSIESPFVVRYVDFRKLNNGYGIIMEDIGGTALTKLYNSTKQHLPLDIFLEIACKITKGIGAIHGAGVIHKNINPANIVYCESTGELNIIDFGISSQLSKSEISPTSIPFGNKDLEAHDKGIEMEGTLEYISPEQTGRMNRVVDYRSDFYSLGVTFYELLTGMLPFTQASPHAYMDLIYRHLAVHPRSILEIRPEVGSALWSVVAKLMAKNAEDRYQDDKGLLYDLQQIQRAHKAGRHENMPGFVAGSQDRAMHLQVSQKLYGREEEVRQLTRNFEQVCGEGTLPSMLMLVHGYSGVGKTLIVNEVHKPLAKSYGNYVSGKFEQFLSASPYAAVIQALKQLIQQILTENESSLKSWQHRLEEGLEGNGKLMIDLIPDLELVIGPQPEVPILEPVENVHRFKDVFIGFISSLACKERPLVIFLDDLQWADSNTLNLLLALLTAKAISNTRYLLIVGAYRDNEVSEDHPLSLTLREIRSKGGTVEDVSVSSLREEQVIQLLDDTFNTNKNSTYKVDMAPLGTLVYRKTQGNPFFVNQLLTTVHKNGHIRFISGLDGQSTEQYHAGWMYDIEAIQEENYTSNVVELMVSMLRKLPLAVQHMVGVAATIGNQVELWLLAVACNISEYEARGILNGAISEGYLIPSSDEFMRTVMFSDENSINLKRLVFPESSTSSSPHITYRFAHDRVQQAAASLISQEDQKIVHGQIAETLLSKFAKDPKDLSNHLLRIATHLNQSFDQSTIEYDTVFGDGETKYISPFHAVSVAEVNYKAAMKAKNANAFQQALTYASLGVTLLAKDQTKAWEKYHLLTFDSYKLCLELQVLTGNYSAADATYTLVLPRATSVQAKTDVYITMFHRFELEHRLAEAIEPVARALELYGFSLPLDAQLQEQVFLADVDLIDKELVRLVKFSDVLELPECVDVNQRNIIKLLMTVWPATYMLGKRYLSGYLSSQVALRSMEHGVCAETGMALVSYVWISGPITGEYVKLNELAKVGLSMLELRFPHQKALRGSSCLLYAIGVSVWVHPLIKAFPYIEMAFELSSQAGNLDFMTFAVIYLVEIPFMCGTTLSLAALEYEKKLTFWKEGNFGLYPFMEAIAQPIWDLQGAQRDFLQGQKYEDTLYPKDFLLTTSYNYAKLFSSLFLRNDMKKWLQYADVSAVSIPISFMGLYKVAEMQTMTSLLYLDWFGRSRYAREVLAPTSHSKCRGDSYDLDADIESEAAQTREQQETTLRRRIEMVKSSIHSLFKASLQCKANFEHKLHLLKAEASRVMLALNYEVIFYDEESTSSLSPTSPRNSEYNTAQDFEDTMELYERAIKGAKLNGFIQYEALGLELYGRFWLTTKRSRPRIALLYLTEAILAYERWGAIEKVRLLSNECARLSSSEPIPLQNMDSLPEKTSASVVSLDLETIVQACQTISNETDVSALTIKMLKTIVENASAERGTFFVVPDGESRPTYAHKDSLLITAEYDYETVPQELEGSSTPAERGVVLYDPKQPLSQWSNGPTSLVRFVGRTHKAVVLKCAHADAQFGSDQYISTNKVKSIICMPILLNKVLKGVMYLENNLCEGMYTQNRVDLLSLLTSQMAISLESIKFLHEQIREQSEKIRFEQLQREETAQRERADAAEKYKVQLENFIDMICHEIRNPLNGIFGNSDLILHHLGQFEEARRKQAWMSLPVLTSPSTQRSAASFTSTNPQSPSLRTNNSISPLNIPSPQLGLVAVPEGSPLDLGGASADIYSSFFEQIRLCIATIQSCAEHQKRMTDDVLQLSRLRSHKLAVEDVYYRPWDMVQTTLRVFSAQADKKGLELRFEPQGLDERSEIFGDRMRTYQILSNFLSNAIKFTLKGSITVVVRIEDSKSIQDDIADGAPHSEAEDHNEVPHKEGSEKETAPCIFTISVADTGIGMSAQEQARIFKRFSQANNRTSKEFGGSGLGLSISIKLAKLMNGTVSLKSEERKGTTFTVRLQCNRVLESSLSLSYSTEVSSFNLPPGTLSLTESVDLPQLPQPPQPPQLPSAKGEEGEAKGKVETPKPQRILVAEDNLMNQTLLSKVLSLKGYIVEITSNGEECVARYQEHQRREGERYYSFILMDVQMPIMDGLVATENIRRLERENNIPPIVIIGLSGNARDEYRQTALTTGMNEYITKPYYKEVLYSALAKNWDLVS